MFNQVVFLRRKLLGMSSVRGMSAHLNGNTPQDQPPRGSRRTYMGEVAGWHLNTMPMQTPTESTLLIRWGCTSSTSIPLGQQLNPSDGIKTVNNKKQFRLALQANEEDIVPLTVDSVDLARTVDTWPLVVRPTHHAQGRNLFVVNDLDELVNVTRKPCMSSGWYASELIDKSAEYRVYMFQGRVATIARKTPADPTQVAWNVAQGGRFDVVPFGEWDMGVVEVAAKAFKHSGLDFSGIDVMVNQEGRAYVVEANSAPSLPFIRDEEVSYRQTKMAQCIQYVMENGKDHFAYPESFDRWQSVIHPAVRSND